MPPSPSGAGRHHGFDQVRDRAWLAAGLNVDVETVDEEVTLILSLPAPSHAFPTGDLFRRLEVGVEWRDEDGAVIGRQTQHLARHFERRTDYPHGRALVGDDRVHLGERRLPFVREEGAPPASSLRWWITLQRVAEIGPGHDDSTVRMESEQPIHEGRLVLEGRRSAAERVKLEEAIR
jgi:hypothetical protein